MQNASFLVLPSSGLFMCISLSLSPSFHGSPHFVSVLLTSFVHVSFPSWVFFYSSLHIIYSRVDRNRAKLHLLRGKLLWPIKHTNLVWYVKFSEEIRKPGREKKKKEGFIKNVIKQIMALRPSHFTSFPLWFDYYSVRIFSAVLLAVKCPILEMSKH